MKSNKSSVSRKKLNINETKQEETEQTRKNGRFTRCYFRAEILQIDKSWTQMILAGNQSKQWGPLHIYLGNQDGVRQRQSFLVTYVPLVPVLAAISLPDNMQLHELIFVKPGLHGLKTATPLSALNSFRDFFLF